MPSWNKILAIFDPFTFSHSQGHSRRLVSLSMSSSRPHHRQSRRKPLILPTPCAGPMPRS